MRWYRTMNNYKLYVHISPNSKKYYGITCQEAHKRWQKGNGYKYNEYFTRAIDKHGWDNFEHIVLFDELTKEEAELMEQMYIALYDTTNPMYGYNQTKGGEGTLGWQPNESWRKKQSDINKGEGNPMYGKESAFKGKHHTEETKQKISRASKGHSRVKGKKHPKAAIYEVRDNNGEFVGYYCGNEFYNMLGVSKGVFNKHIRPYGNIDIARISKNQATQNQHTKNMIEKLRPFDKWTIKGGGADA